MLPQGRPCPAPLVLPPGGHHSGLLLHGVYSKPDNRGVDECTIWGDYYYMEALFRLLYGGCGYWC